MSNSSTKFFRRDNKKGERFKIYVGLDTVQLTVYKGGDHELDEKLLYTETRMIKDGYISESATIFTFNDMEDDRGRILMAELNTWLSNSKEAWLDFESYVDYLAENF